MKLRTALIGPIAFVVLAGITSCGGGSDSPAPTYTVGGTLSGTAGVVLKLNGGSDLTLANSGPFTFTGGLTNGTAYTVTATAPQNCSVANGIGTMGATNVTNVAITCTTVVRAASLSGANEVPPTTSTATGRGAVVVDPATRAIQGGITFAGLTGPATGAHIHRANTTIVLPLTLAAAGNVATVAADAPSLSVADYDELKAGTLYFNVHTAANSGGEIRGQIAVRGGVTAGLTSLDGAHEVPPNASAASGRGMVVVDSATREILIAYVTFNVAGATASHIHAGAAGVAPPSNIRVALTNFAATVASAAQGVAFATAQDLTDLGAGNLYFNVHSPTFPGGEIRGQIAAQ